MAEKSDLEKATDRHCTIPSSRHILHVSNIDEANQKRLHFQWGAEHLLEVASELAAESAKIPSSKYGFGTERNRVYNQAWDEAVKYFLSHLKEHCGK